MTVNEVVSAERKLKKKKATALMINPRLQRRSGRNLSDIQPVSGASNRHRKRRRYHEKTSLQWIQSHPQLKKKWHQQNVDAHGDKANPSGGVSQRKGRDTEERQIQKWKTCTLFQPNKQNQDDNSAEKFNGDERASPGAFLSRGQREQKQRDTERESDRAGENRKALFSPTSL